MRLADDAEETIALTRALIAENTIDPPGNEIAGTPMRLTHPVLLCGPALRRPSAAIATSSNGGI